jgi:opacity protein-like surface antigen
LTPYIGAGAGFAFIDASIQPVGVPATIDLQTSSFAYQFIAGAAMPISQRAQLFAEYRFFGTGDFSLNAAAQGLGSLAADGDLTTHNVFAGLRINLR